MGIKYEPLSDPPVIKICSWGPWGCTLLTILWASSILERVVGYLLLTYSLGIVHSLALICFINYSRVKLKIKVGGGIRKAFFLQEDVKPTSVSCCCCFFFSGSYINKRLKLNTTHSARMCFIVSLLGFLLTTLMYIKCETPSIPGVNTSYQKR